MFNRDTPYESRGGTTDRIKSSVSTSPSMAIIFLCVISFFLEVVLLKMVPSIGELYLRAFQFDPGSILTRPWTLVTYIFLHNGLWHLFFNMLVLYFFGTALERRVGNKQLLGIFFTAGVLSAIGYTFLSQPIFNISPGSMIGASGAIYGVFAALTVLEPNIRVYVYFVPMRLKHALLLFAAFDFLMVNSSDMIAHTAHLSGLFVGLYMGFRMKKIHEKYLKSRYTGRW
ncbi:protease [Methanosarcina sp. 1.H.T.1A.1]|uniref:rhomboid family intramembrane serine protease n=1 Tax=Methanosarcina sp. 1.H.T.1A.1 TaxID=1483602 RepID=UPI000621A473|nr:rhomboid family intramembrane serine protease [Methanosarcina sp. 1.H.T.1A.1]KKH95094.1 protease [Methanosarcina sp. 1.H.T.1A.1]